jgi:hypothetical protein
LQIWPVAQDVPLALTVHAVAEEVGWQVWHALLALTAPVA